MIIGHEPVASTVTPNDFLVLFFVLVFSKSKTWYTFLPFGVLKHNPRCEFWTASFKKETFKSHHLIFKIFIKVGCWVHYQFKGALRQVHTCISVYLSGDVAHRLWKQMYLLKEAFFLALLKMLHSVFLVLDWLWGIKVRLSLSLQSQCWKDLSLTQQNSGINCIYLYCVL